MTRQRDLKKRIRQRMVKTGESYTAARRHVLAGTDNTAPAAREPQTPAGDTSRVSHEQDIMQRLLGERDKSKVLQLVLEKIENGAAVHVCQWRYLARTTGPTIELARERLQQASQHGWLGTEDALPGVPVRVLFPIRQMDEICRHLERLGATVVTDVTTCQEVAQRWRRERRGIEV